MEEPLDSRYSRMSSVLPFSFILQNGPPQAHQADAMQVSMGWITEMDGFFSADSIVIACANGLAHLQGAAFHLVQCSVISYLSLCPSPSLRQVRHQKQLSPVQGYAAASCKLSSTW